MIFLSEAEVAALRYRQTVDNYDADTVAVIRDLGRRFGQEDHYARNVEVFLHQRGYLVDRAPRSHGWGHWRCKLARLRGASKG